MDHIGYSMVGPDTEGEDDVEEVVLDMDGELENEIENSNSKNEWYCLFIDVIKQYPHLFNKFMKDYKDKQKCAASWEEISKTMNKPVADLQKAWKNLKSKFSVERKTIEKKSRSGSGGGRTKKKPWVLYEKMEFLTDHIQRRNTIGNASTSTSPAAVEQVISAPAPVLELEEPESPPAAVTNTGAVQIACSETIHNTSFRKFKAKKPKQTEMAATELITLSATMSKYLNSKLLAESTSSSASSSNASSAHSAECTTPSNPRTSSSTQLFMEWAVNELEELSPEERKVKKRKITEILLGP